MFANNVHREGYKAPFQIQIQNNRTTLAEVTCEPNGAGEFTWDKSEYAKLIPLAVKPNVELNLILTGTVEKHRALSLDFTELQPKHTQAEATA